MKHAPFADVVSLRAHKIGPVVQIAILPARSLTHNHIHARCISHSNPMNLHGAKSTIEFAYRFSQSVIYIILQYIRTLLLK